MATRPVGLTPVWCACGHDQLVHHLTPKSARTWCSVFTAAGPCRCNQYQPHTRHEKDEPVNDEEEGLPRPEPRFPNHTVFQPWDHDPIVAVNGDGRVMADCACGWTGPERTGDEHAARLVEDDVHWHLAVVGGRL